MGKQAKPSEPKRIRVWIAPKAAESTVFAANELARVLSDALAREVPLAPAPAQGKYELVLGTIGGTAGDKHGPANDGFVIAPRAEAVAVSAESGAAIVHGVYRLLAQLGAGFSLDGRFTAPQLCGPFPWSLAAERFEPAFTRRAFVSDIMTYHYEDPARLKLHLEEDRRFLTWLGWQGINRFFYIRHARDTRARIDELVPVLRERGIGAEYGGHILQLLLERERFANAPDCFPLRPDGRRNAQGNLCASNPAAIEVVCRNALAYLREYPEIQLFHIWGADVWEGAWCACPRCVRFSPQLQYMRVVNAIAQRVARLNERLEVAYLAYHDTIEPDPKLAPFANVSFEWAPRERCYRHAIDDPRCTTNRRYWDALRRYTDLFCGRGHIFEYYADALLFGGLSFATPAIIERDLRAYHTLGLRSVSCLTFGAYSVLAYPVNLIAFAASSRTSESGARRAVANAATARHPTYAPEIAKAYHLIASASKLVLTYGDVLRVDKIPARLVPVRRAALNAAAAQIERAIEITEGITTASKASLLRDEIALWQYGARTLRALAAYLGALGQRGSRSVLRAHQAVDDLEAAFNHIRKIRPEAKGVWGEIDLESFHGRWLKALRRGVERQY
jgi:hypothetical protein